MHVNNHLHCNFSSTGEDSMISSLWKYMVISDHMGTHFSSTFTHTGTIIPFGLSKVLVFKFLFEFCYLPYNEQEQQDDYILNKLSS